MSDAGSFEILIAGLEDGVRAIVEELFEGANVTAVKDAEDWAASFPGWNDRMFNAAICGPAMENITGVELAQILQLQCPTIPKYYITVSDNGFEPRNLLKNGFTQVFRLPMDRVLLKTAVMEEVLSGQKKIKIYKPVRIFDIGEGDELEFSTFIFLPLNKKYIRYTAASSPIDKEKLDRLVEHSTSQVWVDHKEMGRFYQYSAKKLRALGEEATSSTEKQEKLKNNVRMLFFDMFDQSVKSDFDGGKELMTQCQNIVAGFVDQKGDSGWYRKILRAMSDSNDSYNHASNVSTFATLFALGIGNQNLEDIAIAGLLHDIGMSQLPAELQDISDSEVSEKDRKTYFSHVETAINMIKNRKIVISPVTERAILHHHERHDGKGWPNGVFGDRVSEEGQLISFADQFDELTRSQAGKPRHAPAQALELIRKNGSIHPLLINRLARLIQSSDAAMSA